jgi:hypothetical protein
MPAPVGAVRRIAKFAEMHFVFITRLCHWVMELAFPAFWSGWYWFSHESHLQLKRYIVIHIDFMAVMLSA